MITAICSEIQGIAKQGQHIHYTHTGKLLVKLDPTLLRNVIINLLSNAIKFSPENATIQISSTVKDNNITIRPGRCPARLGPTREPGLAR